MRTQKPPTILEHWLTFMLDKCFRLLPGNLFLPRGLAKRIGAQKRNRQLINGVGQQLKLSTVSTMTVRRWTWWDDQYDRRTYGQLLHRTDERFPIIAFPFPYQCQYRFGSLPALIHPGTGVIFGLRLNESLSFLRLADKDRQHALEINAAWSRSPLPAQRALAIDQIFGAEWVIPNTLHPNIRQFYEAAYENSEVED